MQVQRKSVPWRKFWSIGGRDYINTGSFKKYIQTLVRTTSSDFKTPQSSLKNTRLRLVFELLSVFENRRKSSSYSCLNYYFEVISADEMLSLQFNRIKQFFVC